MEAYPRHRAYLILITGLTSSQGLPHPHRRAYLILTAGLTSSSLPGLPHHRAYIILIILTAGRTSSQGLPHPHRRAYLIAGLVAEGPLPAGSAHARVLLLTAHRPVLTVAARVDALRAERPRNARWNEETRHRTASQTKAPRDNVTAYENEHYEQSLSPDMSELLARKEDVGLRESSSLKERWKERTKEREKGKKEKKRRRKEGQKDEKKAKTSNTPPPPPPPSTHDPPPKKLKQNSNNKDTKRE